MREMAFEHEKKSALHILTGIEEGTTNASQSFAALDEADETLAYFIVTWLRQRYTGHPAAEGVLGRVGELLEKNPGLAAKLKRGQADSVVEWFEESYTYRDLDGPEFIDLIVEKLEG